MTGRYAGKDAVAYLLDCSSSMQWPTKDGKSFFLVAQDFICKAAESKLYGQSKNEYLLLTFGGGNCPPGGTSKNVEVCRRLAPLDLKFLARVREQTPSNIKGDLVHAIERAVEVIYTETAGRRFRKYRLLVFTNFGCYALQNSLAKLLSSMGESGEIDLIFMCDEDFSNYQTKTGLNAEEENVMQCLTAVAENYHHCSLFTCTQAAASVKYDPVLRNSVKQRFTLNIGNFVSIRIAAYIKVTGCLYPHLKLLKAEPLSLEESKDAEQSCSTKVALPPAEADPEGMEAFVNSIGCFQYSYGTTVVSLTAEEREALKATEGEKGFHVLHFIELKDIKPHYKVGDKSMIIGVEPKCTAYEKAAFDAFVRACHKLNRAPVVRFLRNPKGKPQIGCLYPHLTDNLVAWIYIALPFAEDLRNYSSLLVDKSAKLPSQLQMNAVSQLIDSLDMDAGEVLCSYPADPNYIRNFQAILKDRLKGYEPMSVPQLEVGNWNEKHVSLNDAITDVFNLEVTSKKRELFDDEEEKLESTPKRPKIEAALDDINIGYSNPDEMFVFILKNRKFPFHDVCKKLESRIFEFGEAKDESVGSLILRCLRIYRTEAIKRNYDEQYNTFLVKLESVMREKDLWSQIKDEKLSITK